MPQESGQTNRLLQTPRKTRGMKVLNVPQYASDDSREISVRGVDMHEVYGMKLGDREMDGSRLLYGTEPGKMIKSSYYMWCIKGPAGNILVDTGMIDADVKRRSLINVRTPESLLNAIGVNAKDIKTVIVTHLHSDHFSAWGLYPVATFCMQRKDVEFFATADPKNRPIMTPVSDIAEVIRLHYAGRVKLLNGDEQIVPGIRVFLVGGHTLGSQVVTVDTARGTVVLCGDAVDLYRNIQENLHGGPTLDVVGVYTAYDKIRKLAASPDLIIPGHESLLMEKFPVVGDAIVKVG